MFEPSDLDKMFLTPANSTTALTAPPALTPVPSHAGLSKILLAPIVPTASCGIVPLTIETFTTFFVAAATAFFIASGTSLALPVPIPTRPLRSPTATVAEKRK